MSQHLFYAGALASQNNSLPVELTSLILDHVIASSITPAQANFTLRSCHSLSRSFWLSARERFFRTITLDGLRKSNGTRRLKALLALVKARDDLSIVHWIRTLSINFNLDLFESVLDDSDGTLADILTNLGSAQVQISHFIFLCEGSRGINFVNISTYLNRALRQFVKIGSLESVTITHVYNLPISFFHGAHFQHLQLDRTSYRTSPLVPMITDDGSFIMTDPDANLGLPPPIHSLIIANEEPLSCFARPNDTSLTDLRKLQATVSSIVCTRNLQLILEKASQSLVTCSLTLDPTSRFSIKLSGLNQLNSLSELEIVLLPGGWHGDRENREKGLQTIALLLQITAPIPNSVHLTVILQLGHQKKSSLFDDEGGLNDPLWDTIDRNLADPSKFGAARTRKIIYQNTTSFPSSPEVPTQKLLNCLHKKTLRRCLDPNHQHRYVLDIK